jgi:hypothetical protein
MTGFIRGLFGGKKSEERSAEPPKDNQEESFFLDFDEARSLGKLDYMREGTVIERTFPKTKANPGERRFVQKVSSLEASIVEVSQGLPQAEKLERERLSNVAKEAAQQAPSRPMAMKRDADAPPTAEAEGNRRGGGDLAMFRKMVKDLRNS